MSPWRKYKSVLIVEDDITIRETLKDVIEAAGYIVFMASNGVEALRKLDALGEASRPCLILTDLMMPHMDGRELISRLQKEDHAIASIPVIVMSAQDNQGVVSRKFIRKPFNLDDLMSSIDELMKEGCSHG